MNIYLIFNSDIVNFVLKTDGGGEVGMGVGVQKALFYYLIYFFGVLIVGGKRRFGWAESLI